MLVELARSEGFYTRDLAPLFENVRWRLERGCVVDHRPTTERRAGKDQDTEVARGQGGSVEIHLAQRGDLAVVKVALVSIAALLDDDDIESRLREARRDAASAGPRSHHDGVARQCFVGGD